MTNLMKSIKKVKKPVFRMFLVGTYGVAQKAKELSDYRSGIQDGTDLQADLRTGDLYDEEDLDEDEKGPEAEPAKEKSLRVPREPRWTRSSSTKARDRTNSQVKAYTTCSVSPCEQGGDRSPYSRRGEKGRR